MNSGEPARVPDGGACTGLRLGDSFLGIEGGDDAILNGPPLKAALDAGAPFLKSDDGDGWKTGLRFGESFLRFEDTGG